MKVPYWKMLSLQLNSVYDYPQANEVVAINSKREKDAWPLSYHCCVDLIVSDLKYIRRYFIEYYSIKLIVIKSIKCHIFAMRTVLTIFVNNEYSSVFLSFVCIT